jgi:hypothetical protein
MPKRPVLVVLLLSICAFSAHGGVLYSFSFTPSYGPIQSLAFSFAVPTFVTAGQSPAFSPVIITDGVDSDTLTMDIAAVNSQGNFCFNFGAAVNTQLYSDCATGWGAPNGGVLVTLFSGGLPTAAGTFTATTGFASFYTGTSTYDESSGAVTLAVSDVPEPSSGSLIFSTLLAFMLMAAAATIQRRIAGTCHRWW